MASCLCKYYSNHSNLFRSTKVGLKWARAYSGDDALGQPIENWVRATSSWFKVGEALSKGLVLLQEATPLDVANFGVTAVDLLKSLSNKPSDYRKWGLITLSDQSMRTVNIIKYGSNIVLKTFLLGKNWKGQSALKKLFAMTWIAIACSAFIKTFYDGYRSGQSAEKPYFEPGIERMFFYSRSLKPLDSNHPISKLFFIEYLSSDIVRRYLETTAVALSLLLFWEELSTANN